MTKKGTLNVASAGADFCEEFVDNRDFFDTQYSQNEWILRALDTNSCFMSAYAFMIGCYPDTTEGVIPDPRIDGYISEVVEGTIEQTDQI